VPPKLFAVQAAVYTNYHISDPATFYNREDVWDVPAGLSPYYVEMRLPGSPQAEYLQILPFTPFRKQNLVSWLAVRNDTPHYGEMVSFVLPKDKWSSVPSRSPAGFSRRRRSRVTGRCSTHRDRA